MGLEGLTAKPRIAPPPVLMAQMSMPMLLYQPYGGPVRALAVIPGGNRVVVGSDDGYVRIWDINSGMLICAINTGGGAIRGLAVNPSNPIGQILVASTDGYVRVYNPDSISAAI